MIGDDEDEMIFSLSPFFSHTLSFFPSRPYYIILFSTLSGIYFSAENFLARNLSLHFENHTAISYLYIFFFFPAPKPRRVLHLFRVSAIVSPCGSPPSVLFGHSCHILPTFLFFFLYLWPPFDPSAAALTFLSLRALFFSFLLYPFSIFRRALARSPFLPSGPQKPGVRRTWL